MMKLKVVENEKLKSLTHVRTHPKELLVPVIWFSLFFEYQKAKMESLAIWKIEKCLECHSESSHQCKNSSRRAPRPKNLIFAIFHLFSQKSKKTLGRVENVFRPYDEIESCTEWKVESSRTDNNSSRRTVKFFKSVMKIVKNDYYFQNDITVEWDRSFTRLIRKKKSILVY